MENQLIQLYLRICQTYDTCSTSCFQRLSNNSTPAFTDQELITIFFFGHDNGLFQKKAIYKFTVNYWKAWFPELPSYQTFCYRLNLLEQTFQAMGGEWLRCLKAEIQPEIDRLVDSFPIMLAKHGHAYTARVARFGCQQRLLRGEEDACSRSSIAHCGGSDAADNFRFPTNSGCARASIHDLSSVREQDLHVPTSTLFGDKAYLAPDLQERFKEQATRLLTPHKKPKGGALSEPQKSYNRMMNRLRQPIESFFNWLNEKTQMQNASKVRSTESLLVQCWGKLAFAVLSLVFNY